MNEIPIFEFSKNIDSFEIGFATCRDPNENGIYLMVRKLDHPVKANQKTAEKSGPDHALGGVHFYHVESVDAVISALQIVKKMFENEEDV